MKINFDPKKGVAKAAGFGKDIGQKAVAKVQEGSKVLVDKTKDEAYQLRLKKYNPLFPAVYQSPGFDIPNMIIIVDDAVRRGIDVCEGAIGWLGKESGMEVLYLYDKDIETSGLQFVPAAICDSVYYVDNFDRKRFIQVDAIFKKAHEDKLAELEYVAYSLGAKRCAIQLLESKEEKQEAKKKVGMKESAKGKGISASVEETSEQEMKHSEKEERNGISESIFRGNDNPRRPELKWFAHDDNIKRLIDMRCNDINSIQTKTLKLSGASSATMSKKVACAIDAAVGKFGGKASAKGEGSMEAKASSESKSTLVFTVEF